MIGHALEAAVYAYLGGTALLMAIPIVSYTLEGSLTMSATPPNPTATTTTTTAPASPAPAPRPPGFVANPIGLLHSGAGGGRPSRVAATRGAVFAFGVYGLLEAVSRLLARGGRPALAGEAVAVTAAISTFVLHLLHAIWADRPPVPSPVSSPESRP